VSSTRREFIRRFGVALASLLATRCTASDQTIRYTPTPLAVDLTRVPIEIMQQARDRPSERVREVWLALESLAAQTKEDSKRGETAQQALAGEHRSALDDLVRSGALTEGAADHVQVAFEEAAEHVWMMAVPVTCYKEVILDYRPVSREDLIAQAEVLAQTQDLDPDTVTVAQAAIAQDMTFLELSPDEARSLHDGIIQGTGPGTPFPPLEDVELDVPPEAVEAAQFLVHVLLGE
jgi:hypothetical protein